MCRQFRGLHFHEIRFDVLDNTIARRRRQKIDNGRMNFGRRRERPAVFAAALDDFHDLIGQLFVNAAIGLCLQFPFGNRCAMVLTRAVPHRESSGDVG